MGTPKNKKPAISNVAPSETETALLIITPPSTTAQPAVFFVTDAKTGECLTTIHSIGPLVVKQDLIYEHLEDWTEKYEKFELKFIDETDVSMDELATLSGQWERSQELKIEKAGLADDEQP